MGSRRFFSAGLLAASTLLAAPPGPVAAAEGDPARGDSACNAVEAAVRTISEAERFHSKLVARTPGRRRPAEEEQVVIGDVVYASSPAAGRWVKLPLTAADRRALSAGIAARPPRDCRDEGAAELGGAPVRVYAYDQELPGRDGAVSLARGRLWVGTADGRPRRYEGQHGEVSVVLTFDYDAVEPPFGKR